MVVVVLLLSLWQCQRHCYRPDSPLCSHCDAFSVHGGNLSFFGSTCALYWQNWEEERDEGGGGHHGGSNPCAAVCFGSLPLRPLFRCCSRSYSCTLSASFLPGAAHLRSFDRALTLPFPPSFHLRPDPLNGDLMLSSLPDTRS